MTVRQQWSVVGGVVLALALAFAVGDRYVGRQFALVTLGSRAPDFRAVAVLPASGTPASTTPASPTPVSTAPVSTAPVSTAPVSTAPQVKTLDEYKGDVVLLNIWATWCPPCRVEMPSIEALQRTYGPRGLRIIAVSVDAPGTDSTIRAFARQYGLTFEILHDPTVGPFAPDGDRTPGRIEQAYQTTGVPETFVIARDGVIRKKVIGADNWSSPGNQSLIAELLREPAS